MTYTIRLNKDRAPKGARPQRVKSNDEMLREILDRVTRIETRQAKQMESNGLDIFGNQLTDKGN